MKVLSTTVGGLLLVLTCQALPALAGEREAGREIRPQGSGWSKVAEGVWQRASAGRVQTWAAGIAGMRYALGELERELANATRAYLNNPSAEHERALRAHLSTIERTRRYLDEGAGWPRQNAGGTEKAKPAPTLWCGVAFPFADATAEPDPSGDGASASSFAYWDGRINYDCVGTTYARATASVTTGEVTSTDEQICTLTGDYFTASFCWASAAETGFANSTCSSSAFAYTASDDFPFYVSDSASNGDC